jgi:hypothetical protein
VQNFVIIEAKKVAEKDQRLKVYSSIPSQASALLSLHDAHRKCIEYAQEND